MTKIVVNRIISRPSIQLKRKSTLSLRDSGGSIYVHDLRDIEASTPSNKEILIFNEEKNKYEIRTITGEDIEGPLDGGNF